MIVEITEKRLRDVDPETRLLYVQTTGDVITVPDALGARWCALGWARDVDGKVETGPRTAGGVVVQPDSARHVSINSNLHRR